MTASTRGPPKLCSISVIADTATFTLTTDVLHLGGSVTKVTAKVEGQDLSFNLVKTGDVVGGERWAITTQITLWRGLSAGTYNIDITATDNTNTSVTQTTATTVTVTN